jgi:hypothetical protein
MSQKIALFIVTAVGTSNPTIRRFIFECTGNLNNSSRKWILHKLSFHRESISILSKF